VGLSKPSADTSEMRSEEVVLCVRETGSLSLMMDNSWFFWSSRTASRISCASLMVDVFD